MRSLYSIITLKQDGDTIVEVLITIAVLSLVLAAAFITSNRSLLTVQDTQEHSEAQNILQSQVEVLRSLDQTDLDSIFNPETPADKANFCLAQDPTTHAYIRVPLIGTDKTTIPALANDDLSSASYPAACQNNGRYFLSVTYNKSDDDLFTFRARWDRLRNGRDEVTYFYRYHPGVATSAVSAPPPPPPVGAPPVCPQPLSPPITGIDDINPDDNTPDDQQPWDLYSNRAGNHLTYTLPASKSAGLAGIKPNSSQCRYEISITTADRGHPDRDQPNERLFASFFAADGTKLGTTLLTQDLPNSQQAISSDVGSIIFSETPTKIIFYHYSLWPGAKDDGTQDSIQPRSIQLTALP